MFDDLNSRPTGSALAELTEKLKLKQKQASASADVATPPAPAANSPEAEPESPAKSKDFFEEHHYASLLLKGSLPVGKASAVPQLMAPATASTSEPLPLATTQPAAKPASVSKPTFSETTTSQTATNKKQVGSYTKPLAGDPKAGQEEAFATDVPPMAASAPHDKVEVEPSFYNLSDEFLQVAEKRDLLSAEDLDEQADSGRQAHIAAAELTSLFEIASESAPFVPSYEETDFGAALQALAERTGQAHVTYKDISELARDTSIKGGEAVVIAALLKHWFDLCKVYERTWWQAEILFDELREWVEDQPEPGALLDATCRMRWDFRGSLLMGEQRLLGKGEGLFKDLHSPVASVTPEAVYAGEGGSQSLLAVLASMAAFNPGLVVKLVSSNRDGSYTVCFPGFKVGGIEVPELTDTEIAGGCAPVTQHGSWVAVLEKALGRYLKQCALSLLPSCDVLELIPDRIFDCRLLLLLGVTLPGLNATCGDYVIPAWTDAFWSKPDRIARLWDRYLRGAKAQGRPAIAMNYRHVLGVVDYEPDKYDMQKSKVTLYDHHKGQRVTMSLGHCIENYSAVAFGSSAGERSTWQYYLSKLMEFKLMPYIASNAF